MTITVSTDGSALGNPNGPMGWAWADHQPDTHTHECRSDAGGASNGTNQLGELCAVLQALRSHRGAQTLVIESDSQYAIKSSTTWLRGWKKNGWRNSQKKPVKNAPVIKAIDTEIEQREGRVDFKWVKGHAGNPGNEKVDELAHGYSSDCGAGLKDGYLPLEGWQSLMQSQYAQGTDIPSDAQLLLDGKITPEDYQLEHCDYGGSFGPGRDGIPTGQSPQTPKEAPSAPPLQETPPGATPNAVASGLSVSGKLTFSPPPQSSPSYNGQPKHVVGTIEVEGDVQADGTIILDAVQFHLR